MKRFILLLIFSLTLLGSGAAVSYADEVTPAQTVQAGQTAAIPLEIANDTAADHTYQLNVSGLPTGLTATFSQGGPLLDSVTVSAHGYGPLTLRIEVPAETPVGHYAARFSATRDDGAVLTRPLALTVENTYAVKITAQAATVNAFSGQEFTFETTAANTGAAPVTNLTLAVDAPAKWLVRLDPPLVDSLAPGRTATFQAKVLVPASQISIDQPLSLSLSSDQTTSAASTLTVRVQKSPGYLLGAGLAMGLAVAGAFVYFKVKGRR